MIVGPDEGPLASGFSGHGSARADGAAVCASRRGCLGSGGISPGGGIVVTAGGTQEPLDPVRYIGNRSSGRMGYAIAAAAARAGRT